MKLEYEREQKVKQALRDIVRRYLDLKAYHVFIFGSRVTGASTQWSDIDVGIEGAEPVPLHLLAKIREEIERLPFLYRIDVLDFSQTSSQFREVAKKGVEFLS